MTPSSRIYLKRVQCSGLPLPRCCCPLRTATRVTLRCSSSESLFHTSGCTCMAATQQLSTYSPVRRKLPAASSTRHNGECSCKGAHTPWWWVTKRRIRLSSKSSCCVALPSLLLLSSPLLLPPPATLTRLPNLLSIVVFTELRPILLCASVPPILEFFSPWISGDQPSLCVLRYPMLLARQRWQHFL